jgi:hypothetical protein
MNFARAKVAAAIAPLAAMAMTVMMTWMMAFSLSQGGIRVPVCLTT